jgi:hypothetical protein
MISKVAILLRAAVTTVVNTGIPYPITEIVIAVTAAIPYNQNTK